MKELSIEQKAQIYDKVREKIALRFGSNVVEEIFSEFEMNEDEKIRKEIIEYIKIGTYHKDWLAWLEKQESVDENEVAKRVLNEVANSIMCWLDSNCTEGNMCLSGMECEDIENAVRNANWQKIYGYMKKKLEKQGKSDETKAKMFLINKGYPIDANGIFPTYEEIYNIIREGLEKQSE